MAPLTPDWVQPSHPEIQEVIFSSASSSSSDEDEYTTKSVSRVSVPPFGVFATLDYPPCTKAAEATYATVQCGKGRNGEGEHLNLNSDLVYINHSCDPSLVSPAFSLPLMCIFCSYALTPTTLVFLTRDILSVPVLDTCFHVNFADLPLLIRQ